MVRDSGVAVMRALTAILTRSPWRISSPVTWLGFAIGASGVVVVAAVVLSAAPSAVYHLGCVLGIILLIAGMSVVLVGRWREIQSDEDGP